MPYCMFRLFKEIRPVQDRYERVRSEMMGKVRAIPGFQRWVSLRTEDGRYGGFQVYDTREGIEQARRLFNDWRRSAGFDDPVALEVTGELGLSIAMRADFDSGYGVARLYRISAPFQEVNEAIEQEAGDVIRAVSGLYRYTTALLDDGRLGVFNAFATEQGAREMTAKAQELRSRSARLRKVLPSDPEVIAGRIELAFTKQPAPAHAA